MVSAKITKKTNNYKRNISNDKRKSKAENKINNNKVIKNIDLIIPFVIIIMLLIFLVIGSSFAYFQVVASNNSSTTKINTSIENVGSIAIESIGNDIVMDLSSLQMMQQGTDVTYYASTSGVTTTETTEEIGKIQVTGNGIFKCDYSFDIVASSNSTESNLYTKFQNMSTKSTGQIVLTINASDTTKVYDFYTAGLFTSENSYKQVFSGTITGVKEGSPESITAQFKFANKTGVIQDNLKNADISLSISVSNFKCDIEG